ncbi:RHS repeat-associated core domain-containing protein [Streptomyces tsukubensis]|uniref:RHS repeat-associated core domain-containing protein n=1 Tax=Streptomyces tsukubensis TaxID=83656 RepID=UPI00344F3B2E
METVGAKKARDRVAKERAADMAGINRAVQQQKGSRWPAAGTVTVPLSDSLRTSKAGGLALGVKSTDRKRTAPASATARLTVLDRQATAAVGVDGVLLTARTEQPVTTDLTVDYSSFASVIGGGWASRLKLWQLPACALTTPKAPDCRRLTPLDTRNDIRAQRLTAKAPLTANTVLAVAATGAGQSPSGAGDYSATPLSASSTWTSGGSSGAFTWSYDMGVPALAAGPVPTLGLSYDSGSIDGRTASTNNQGTEVGEGFDLTAVSYIERKYDSCHKDGHDKKYDLCWKYENASLVLNGKSTELVKDDTSGVWRLKDDDASIVTYSVGADNGDDNGERWTVTTGNGTKYHFGRDKLPGAGTERTNSVWTVPVFGDDTGEPGYDAGNAFANRSLNQAWRWNLDLVEDVHGNAMTYWYTAETNHYRKNKASTADTKYTTSGYLHRIRYGQRADTLFSETAPGVVSLTHADRCTAADCAPLTETTANKWPDVPFDALCTAGENDTDCIAESPAFFSRKRLAKVEVSVLSGTAYAPVDSWTLGNRFVDNGDLADPSDQTLVLESVQRTGHTGTPITLDPVSFTYHRRPNRVAGGTQPGGGNILPLTRPRVASVTTETGAITNVSYNDPECVRGSASMPAAEDSNTKSCYPQYWNINGATDASIDWFHKYRVVAVTASDPAGHGEPVEYAYTYENPAWRHNDSPFVPTAERTWSLWRGYGKVTAWTGAANGTRSRTVTGYLQGMHGDRIKAGGTRTVSAPGIDLTGLNVPAVTDSEQYVGFQRQQITYDGSTPVSVTVDDPWSARTATQHKSHADTEAHYVRTRTTYQHTYLPLKQSWRTTSSTTDHDSYGMPVKVASAGDIAKTGDETCTRTWYARNPGAGLTSTVSRTRTVGSVCTTDEADLNLPASTATRGDVISDTATVYDITPNETTTWTADQTPTKGLATWTARASAYPPTATGGERPPSAWQRQATTAYDTLGRPLSVMDAADRTTTTAYTPPGAGVTTKTVVTNPKNHTVTTYLDGLRGLPLRIHDANNKKTEQVYDSLGRVTGVWLPNRSRAAAQSATTSFAYTLRRGVVPSIATSTIKSSSTVTTSYEIFDSLLRPLQKQTSTPLGGRLLTDTRYDSRGLAYESYAGIYDTTSAPNSTYARAEFGEAPRQLQTVLDGAGRAVSSSLLVFGVKKWQTTTAHTGDSTATSAPSGGQAVRVVTDALGRTTERREYAGTSFTDADFGGGLGSGRTTTLYTYTRDGKQATVTGPDGGQWSYTYDLFGRRLSESDPDKGTTRTGYTVLDQADWTKNSENGQLLYDYDELGRKTGLWSGTERSNVNKLAAWTYDTLAKGQPDGSVRYYGGTAGEAYGKKIVAYDALYRATQTQVTLAATDDLVIAGAAATSYSFSTSYDLDGSVGSSTEPAAAGLASEIISYRYTPTGQPVGISGSSGYLLDATYSAQGQPQQLVLGLSGATEAKKAYIDKRYEPGTDRLTRSFVTTPQTAPFKPQDLSYTYDDAGNVTKIADTPNADPSLKTDIQCFSYDGHRRLTEAWTPSTDNCTSRTLGGAAPYRTAFTYNASGQRATETRTPVTGTATTTTYCYQDPERRHALTRTTTATECGAPSAEAMYAYDKTGNTTKRPAPGTGTQALTWNAEGKLTELAQGTRKTGYLYDADGTLLIRRAVTGDGESVLYLGATEIHHKAVGTTKTTWATRTYVAGGITVALRSTESGTSRVSFLAADRHGTASLALDATTQAVSKRFTTPFGAPRGTAVGTWPDDKRFLGKPVDTATGLTHVGARQYDPAIGQFISVDPLMEMDKHQTLNGYTYGAQNPATFSDPSGLGLACGKKDMPACPKRPDGTPGNGRPDEGVDHSKPKPGSSGGHGGGNGRGGGSSGGGTHCYSGNMSASCPAPNRGAPAPNPVYVQILQFMVDEMNANAKSETAAAIRCAMIPTECFSLNGWIPEISPAVLAHTSAPGTGFIAGLGIWTAMVHSEGPWDHKHQLDEKFELKERRLYRTPITTDPGSKSVLYDVWSNIHYGYVGRKAAISEGVLMKGSQVSERGVGHTDEGDNISIRAGYRLFEETESSGKDVTVEQLHRIVMETIPDWEAAPGLGWGEKIK